MISTSGALSILGATLSTPSTTNNASLALLWGATGEQEWTPALTTGIYCYTSSSFWFYLRSQLCGHLYIRSSISVICGCPVIFISNRIKTGLVVLFP